MSKAETGDFAADLDTEVARSRTGSCWYCEHIGGTEIDAAVRAKLEAVKGPRPWSAIARVLERHGFEGVNSKKVENHFIANDKVRHGLA